MCNCYTMPARLTIKQLHAQTGVHVRKAGASRAPVIITDRGQPVAALTSPALLKTRNRKRTILPEFATMMARRPGRDVHEDLAAVRGDR